MRCGQREGSLRRTSEKQTDDDSDSECSVIDGSCKANFRSPCVLYLWEHAEQYNLIDAVCQQLSEECSSFDTLAKGKNKLVSTARKRKVKDAMKPGTLQLTQERDFVAITNAKLT